MGDVGVGKGYRTRCPCLGKELCDIKSRIQWGTSGAPVVWRMAHPCILCAVPCLPCAVLPLPAHLHPALPICIQPSAPPPAHLYPAMLAMELRESNIWARLQGTNKEGKPVTEGSIETTFRMLIRRCLQRDKGSRRRGREGKLVPAIRCQDVHANPTIHAGPLMPVYPT